MLNVIRIMLRIDDELYVFQKIKGYKQSNIEIVKGGSEVRASVEIFRALLSRTVKVPREKARTS